MTNADEQPSPDHEGGTDDPADHERRRRSQRHDPDAPGNFVDDETASEVPEPNEPG